MYMQMSDLARTRAYYSTRPALAAFNAAADRSRARRRRRALLMRRRNAAKLHMTRVALLPWETTPAAVPVPVPVPRRSDVPAAGAVAVPGRQREMEDAVTIWTSLCSPLLNRSLPVHYYAVYDGHGGSHFSTMCQQKMHEILKDELTSGAAPGRIIEESLLHQTWKELMNRVFARTEMVALHTCVCGSVGFRCGCERRSVSYSGTTAVVVVVTEKHLVVGNCGDSRAVLYRGGRMIPLSIDQKPDRADEKARVEASGGRVVNRDTPRVQGVLAMSRAIGDVFLKPYVISEPEVRLIRREEDDDFMIVASDGMWDMVTNDMAGRVAHHCLREPYTDEWPPSTKPRPSRCTSAASLLARLALARKSVDNIAVVVVDLKSG